MSTGEGMRHLPSGDSPMNTSKNTRPAPCMTIRFTTDKNGRRIAQERVGSRWVRIDADEAEFLVATGAAVRGA